MSRQKFILFQYHYHRGETRDQISLPSSFGQKGWRVSRAGVERAGHLCLLTGQTQRKSKICCIFTAGGCFTIWSKGPAEVSLLLASHRDWETGTLSSLIITFQRWFSSPWQRQHSWVVKLAIGFLKDLHLKRVGKGFGITADFLK